MKNLIISLFLIFLFIKHTFSQNFSKIYGDNLNNTASVIKQFGNGVYVAGLKLNNGVTTATISKLDVNTAAIIWQKEMGIPSEIMDMEFIPRGPSSGFPDKIALVGRTLPINVSGVPQENKSFILTINSVTGAIIDSRLFDKPGRESFNRIIRHPNPVDPSYPYYVLGSINVKNDPNFPPPNTIDSVVLINFNEALDYKFYNLYGGSPNQPEKDMEFYRGIITLQNGDLLLVGNKTNLNGNGALVRVVGANGNLVYSTSYIRTMDILDGIELPTGEIVIVGEYYPNQNTSNAFIGLLQVNNSPFGYSFKNNIFYFYEDLKRFKDIWTDGNQLFVTGPNQTSSIHSQSVNVTLKLSLLAGPLYSFSGVGNYLFETGENTFDEASTFYSTTTGKFYLTDSKLGNSTFGGKEIFVEAMNTNFVTGCSTTDTLINRSFGIDNDALFLIKNTIIPTSQTFTLNPLNYRIEEHCLACNMNAEITNTFAACFQVQFDAIVTLGTSPYLYSWDINCDGGTPEYTIQNPTHQFPSSGTYKVCLKVTDALGCMAFDTIQVVVPPDIAVPMIMCPPSITLSTDPNKCTAGYNAIVTATDNCDQNPTISCTATGATIGILPGGTFIYNKGITTVNCSAIDDSGNKSLPCSFSVTVIDQQKPTITCPPDQSLAIPFCSGGQIVIFNDPVISDNCPMTTFSCSTHSGDTLPCGNNIIVCTATDMTGNTASCSFNVNIQCNCISTYGDTIECGVQPNTYTFAIGINNLSGSGLPCTITTSLDPLQGSITSSVIMWDPSYTTANIHGTIQSVNPIPPIFNLIINASCTCVNGQVINCTNNIPLIPKCCLTAQLNDAEICKHDNEFTIPVLVNGGVFNITQAKWYITPEPCDNNSIWILYQESDLASTVVFPPYLSDNPAYASGFCMYAVVSVSDFPCAELISDTAHFKFCDFDSCRLELSQQYCYIGNPIVPNPINLTIVSSGCSKTIDWIDPSGNIIPGQTGQFSYQPPPLDFTLSNTACLQAYKYGVQLTGPCGISKCYAEITLYNNDAPVGTIEMNPSEPQPFCPGEDATLTFSPNCPMPPTPVEWIWYYKQLVGTSGNSVLLPGAGNMNPLIQTNRLWEDTWFYVETKNGSCPDKQTNFFIDVRDNLKVINFTANPHNICRNNGVDLSLEYLPTDCNVHITWYKDGLPIFSSDYSSSPAIYYYFDPILNGHYGGNYYAVIKSNCCDDQVLKTEIDVIGPPMELALHGPCFWCSGDINLEVEILNSIGNQSLCTYQWYEIDNTGMQIVIPGATSATMIRNCGGHYQVKVNCGGCELFTDINVEICNTCIVGNSDINDYLTQLKIFPNPAAEELNIKLAGKYLKSGTRIEIINVSGQVIKKQMVLSVIDTYKFSIANLPSAIYYVRVQLKDGYIAYGRFIKI